MKKVMHVAQSAGGVSRYLESYLDNTNKNDYESILIVSPHYRSKIETFNKICKKVIFLDMNRDINIRSDLKCILKLRKLIKTHAPDIVYAHSSKAGAVTRIAMMGLSIPVVYNAHGWSFNMRENHFKRIIYTFIERILSFKTQAIVCISKYEMESAVKKKICSKKKLHLIYNGIDTQKQLNDDYESYNIRNKNNIPCNAFIIGCVGRLSNQKSPLEFVEVAKELSKIMEECYFIWVGDGELRDQVEKLLEKYELKDKFLITGWINNPNKYIDIFDVALLLSKWEGFGLVLAEYMLQKKPIIATNIDAITELVDNKKGGLIVELDNISKITDAIIAIKDNSKIKNEYIDYSYEKVINLFDIKRVVREHEELFELVMNSNL